MYTVMDKTIPTYIIVDIEDVVKDFVGHRAQYPLYQKFPLSEIIRVILLMIPYHDTGEFLWHETEKRVAPEMDLNYELLDLFYESLMIRLDEEIGKRVPPHIEASEYLFHKWLGPHTVMLQREAMY